MEVYKTIRNIAAATLIASLPYICNDGCAYSGNKTFAKETKQIVTCSERTPTIETGKLEVVLEK